MEIIIIGIVILIAGAVFIFCLTKLGGHSDSGASGKKTEKTSSGEKKAPKDKAPKDKPPKDKTSKGTLAKDTREPPVKPEPAPVPKDTPRDLPDPEPGPDTISFFKAEYKPKHIWICSCCGVENAQDQTICEVCGTEKTKA